MKTVAPPPHKRLDSALFWGINNELPDWKVIGRHLHKEGRIHKKDLLRLIE